MTAPLRDVADFRHFVDGLDHAECVAWGPDGYVYAGGEAGQIYRVDLDTGEVAQIGSTGGFILGLALDADGNIFACDMGHHAVKRITPDGTVSTYSAGTPDRPMRTPNYPVFDERGNLYVSDSGGFHDHNGCLYRVRPGGATEVISEELCQFPNGMALSPDGEALYVVMSNIPSVVRLPLGDGDRPAGRPETVIALDRVVPDGLAFDEEGSLYIACYTPDIIYRLSPQGALDVLVDDWESVTFATPTNIAFCGSDRKTLVAASLSRWHLTKGPMPVAGHPLAYPRL